MQIYWYWPFVRREELELASAVPVPGDRLLVHSTPRAGDQPLESTGTYELDLSLPWVSDASEGSARWLGSRAGTYVRRASQRARVIRSGRFDICHVFYLNYFTDWTALARLRRRVPLVSSVHDVVPHQSRVPHRIEYQLLAAQYRNAGTIVVLHESIRRRLVEEFDVSPDRVEVVPLQVPAVAAGSSGLRGSSVPTVLLFGTLRRNKGVDVFLAAAEALRDLLDIRFVIAGRGAPDIEALVWEAAARDARIIAQVGYVTAERKTELYSQADIVVLPYTSFASQSAVLNDAYAHGVPVVVTDVGALGETVRDEGTGRVVASGDAVQLAQAIVELLANPQARERASSAEHAVAQARSPQVTGARLRALYERVSSE